MLPSRRVSLLALCLAIGAGCGDDEGPDYVPVGDGGTARGPTRLHVRVVDARSRQPIGAMVALFDATSGERLRFGRYEDEGAAGMGATAIEVGQGGALITWHGLAVWRGEAIVPVGRTWDLDGPAIVNRSIPHGQYRLVANRGVAYDLTELSVDLSANRGDVFVEIPLSRAVDTTGYMSADLHVHSSGSSDSRLAPRDRIKSMVVAGVDVVVASDHDMHTDLGEAARALWPEPNDPPPIGTVNGNEIEGPSSHWNIFPVVVDRTKPRNGALPNMGRGMIETFLPTLRGLPGRPVIQMNHTRLGVAAYFDSPYCGPWRNRDRSRLPPCPLDFDAMEVLSGYLTCGLRIREQVEDWYALARFGVVVTATGNSDTHGTSRLLGGYPRTYVRMTNDDPKRFDEAAFVGALRGRRAMATSGPFLTLRVNQEAEEGALVLGTGGKVKAKVRMQAASWIQVDEVRLVVNGSTVKSWPVPRVGEATPLLEAEAELELPADAFITAEADGKKALPGFVVGEWTGEALLYENGPYTCPALPGSEQGMAVFAVTNAILVDADGDGRYRGPQQAN